MLSKPSASYASATSDTPLIGRTIGDDFDLAVARFGDREALVDCATARRWTYSELDVEVDELALGLMELGVLRGDRVGIWAPSCAEWVLLQYATAKIGAVLVNVDPQCGSSELTMVVRQSGMRLLVSAVSHRGSDYRAMVDAARPDCPGVRDVVYLGEDSWTSLATRGGVRDHVALEERMDSLSFDDPITIQYASGATGFVKGATLSHHNILNNAFFVGQLVGYTQADRICVPLPFHHGFGMVMGNLAATSHGACMVIPAPSFDAEATLRAVADERCTSLFGVPTMFVAELALDDFDSFDLATLRTAVMAGSSSAEVVRTVADRMHLSEVAICQGIAGTSLVSTMTRPDDDPEHRGQPAGRTMPHLESKVVDPATGLVVPRGTAGELCTRGHTVMLGYWNAPDETAEAIDAARWLHTGNMAVMDAAGYITISGRVDPVGSPAERHAHSPA